MEPLLVFFVLLVAYCGWLTIMDELRPVRPLPGRRPIMERRRVQRPVKCPVKTVGRAGGVAADWPVHAKGSA